VTGRPGDGRRGLGPGRGGPECPPSGRVSGDRPEQRFDRSPSGPPTWPFTRSARGWPSGEPGHKNTASPGLDRRRARGRGACNLQAQVDHQAPVRALVRALRRLRARRSSSLMPPHTPASWPLSSAQVRHSVLTGQRRQTVLASATCNSAGPEVPTGKNSSGSSSRQLARWRQSMIALLLASARCPARISLFSTDVSLVNSFTSDRAIQGFLGSWVRASSPTHRNRVYGYLPRVTDYAERLTEPAGPVLDLRVRADRAGGLLPAVVLASRTTVNDHGQWRESQRDRRFSSVGEWRKTVWTRSPDRLVTAASRGSHTTTRSAPGTETNSTSLRSPR
jgi:hypothetical protein